MSIATAFMLTAPSASANMSSDKRFQYAMKTVLRHEGGLSNDKNDAGSWTRFGVSLRFLREEHLDVNGDGVISKDDIIHLTLTEADNIYYKDFYKRNHYDEITNEHILTKVLDFAVNAGSGQANKILKRAINRIVSEPISVNGSLDKKTIQIVNLLDPAALYSAFVTEQEDFYLSIVKKNPHLRVFLRGWLVRCND